MTLKIVNSVKGRIQTHTAQLQQIIEKLDLIPAPFSSLCVNILLQAKPPRSNECQRWHAHPVCESKEGYGENGI